MSFLQKLQKAHRYFFASCWTWWWHLLPNLLQQDVMARQLCWSFRHNSYYWRWRRAYKLSKMQWKGKSKRLCNKGPFVYYVSMFWGFFWTTYLSKDWCRVKDSKRTSKTLLRLLSFSLHQSLRLWNLLRTIKKSVFLKFWSETLWIIRTLVVW